MTEPVTKVVRGQGLRNIILFGFSFMLILTALWTTLSIEQTILKSVQKEDDTFTGDGYTSLAIVYLVMALANFLSPSLLAILKAKWTLVICSCFYVLFIINLIFTTTWSLYLSSVLLGIAAAGVWTAQGNYITLNSTKDTIIRNTGIFWVFLCFSQFIGNTVVFWQFSGKTHIDADTRTIVLSLLSCIGSFGVICFLFLRNTRPKSKSCGSLEGKCTSAEGPIAAFAKSMKLLQDRKMQMLIITFLYLGTNQCFYSGVYPTSIGFTKQFGTISKSLVGLSGICVGAGGLLGGGLIIAIGPLVTAKVGRFPIVLTGFMFVSLAYVLVFLNIPSDASLGPTDAIAGLYPPSPAIAMLCSFFLGFGDSFVHTQIYGTLSSLWQLNSSQAFAALHFFKSSALAFQFFISTQMGLTVQLFILQIISIFSCIAFFFVDQDLKETNNSKCCESSLSKDDSLERIEL